jgi:GT2 family glycosyltransferase
VSGGTGRGREAGHAVPTVSIVVPSWNGRALLADSLPAIAALEYPRERLEVLVFDNGSGDGSVPWLRETWPAVRVLESATNLGFAAACDRAAQAAGGELVAFLNNDLRVAPDWLTRMTSALVSSGAAAAGSRILDWSGTRYDFDGAAMNFYGHGASPRHGRPVRSPVAAISAAAVDAADEAPRPALFACGAAMLVDRARFLASGGFDADYFAYFEDVDLGWRLWLEGERVLFVPAAVAYHHHHGSGLDDERRTALLELNALASIVKNYEDANLARVLPAALLLLEARARLAGGARAATYRDTVARFLDALPALRRKRAVVQARRQRPDRDIVPLFGEPLRPSFFGRAYWREQARVVRAFEIMDIMGIKDIMGDAGMDDFIAELQGRIEELEAALAAARREVEEGDAERARLTAEIARVRDELGRVAEPRRRWDVLRRRGPTAGEE